MFWLDHALFLENLKEIVHENYRMGGGGTYIVLAVEWMVYK